MAVMLAMAMLTFASHRAHAMGVGVAMGEACHVQAHSGVDDRQHGSTQGPVEQSSCCAGICAHFASPVLISLLAGEGPPHAVLPALDQTAVRSLTPGSPHRPPRA